jgi:hypothetical protein
VLDPKIVDEVVEVTDEEVTAAVRGTGMGSESKNARFLVSP